MKVGELIDILSQIPKDYDVTYLGSIGHLYLQEKQISVFDDPKEVILQLNDITIKG